MFTSMTPYETKHYNFLPLEGCVCAASPDEAITIAGRKFNAARGTYQTMTWQSYKGNTHATINHSREVYIPSHGDV
jgi:hypothetical protein